MPSPVTIATCLAWPGVSRSDLEVVRALTDRGVRVADAPWNSGVESFVTASAVILRSNWDYHHHLAAFRQWLSILEIAGVPVWNSPELVRWNVDKRYLLDLAEVGVPVPTTVTLVDSSAAALAAVLDARGWERAVVKPAWGASGHDVSLVERESLPSSFAGSEPADRARARAVVPLRATLERPFLVQEYLSEVASGGEASLVFFEGEYSHALVKQPATGEFRVNPVFGGTTSAWADPPGWVIEQAEAVIATLPEVPLYARVDGVCRDGAFILLELELNEPALGFHLNPGAAARFADAIVARLATVGGVR